MARTPGRLVRAFRLLLVLLVCDAKQAPKATSVATVDTSTSRGTGSNPATKTTGTAGHHSRFTQVAALATSPLLCTLLHRGACTVCGAGHHGPYEEVGSMIKEKAKKAKFFELLKKLREGARVLPAAARDCSEMVGSEM